MRSKGTRRLTLAKARNVVLWSSWSSYASDGYEVAEQWLRAATDEQIMSRANSILDAVAREMEEIRKDGRE